MAEEGRLKFPGGARREVAQSQSQMEVLRAGDVVQRGGLGKSSGSQTFGQNSRGPRVLVRQHDRTPAVSRLELRIHQIYMRSCVGNFLVCCKARPSLRVFSLLQRTCELHQSRIPMCILWQTYWVHSTTGLGGRRHPRYFSSLEIAMVAAPVMLYIMSYAKTKFTDSQSLVYHRGEFLKHSLH
jgi:hypothetical protein